MHVLGTVDDGQAWHGAYAEMPMVHRLRAGPAHLPACCADMIMQPQGAYEYQNATTTLLVRFEMVSSNTRQALWMSQQLQRTNEIHHWFQRSMAVARLPAYTLSNAKMTRAFRRCSALSL